MAASEELGIVGVDSVHYFVRKPERSHRFYTEMFGWKTVARSSEEVIGRTGQQCNVYQGGDIRVAVSSPLNDTCRAARYLRRHPAGIGSMTFLVEDVQRAWDFLVSRDGTPIHAIQDTRVNGGRYQHFSITTAIGDVTFRFAQKTDFEGFAPGFVPVEDSGDSGLKPLEFEAVDHVTNNAPTMAPVRLWMEHVLGMEKCWEIEFHTDDIAPHQPSNSGTGLRSVVMWDPRSGIKFPINEPLHPFFKEGQINIFVEENMGAGIQHLALRVKDVVSTVKKLRGRGVAFFETPDSYYDMAEERLSKVGVDVHAIEHNLDVLAPDGILIDGSPENNYLVQIFLKDAASMYDDKEAGPFFYELIQRCGDSGFGAGNFRALFEAIERDQQTGGDDA